jgi:hypothetical protein
MKPVLNALGSKILILKRDETVSNVAFNLKLRHYTMDADAGSTLADLIDDDSHQDLVGRCRLTL